MNDENTQKLKLACQIKEELNDCLILLLKSVVSCWLTDGTPKQHPEIEISRRRAIEIIAANLELEHETEVIVEREWQRLFNSSPYYYLKTCPWTAFQMTREHWYPFPRAKVRVILFLDFDGVLHPVGTGSTDFTHLRLVEDWLREHRNVLVVISSSWRQVMDFNDLQQIFSEDLRHRIIGKCPDVPKTKYWRHAEIMAWIDRSNYPDHWLALDDAAAEFPPDCEQLILCNNNLGINGCNMLELTKKLIKVSAWS